MTTYREDAAAFEQEPSEAALAAWEQEAEEIEQAQAVAEIAATGIVATLKHWQWEEQEAELYERCLVAQFADDPITRSGSFDGYEMAGLTRPIRERCATQGCPLCQEENA